MENFQSDLEKNLQSDRKENFESDLTESKSKTDRRQQWKWGKLKAVILKKNWLVCEDKKKWETWFQSRFKFFRRVRIFVLSHKMKTKLSFLQGLRDLTVEFGTVEGLPCSYKDEVVSLKCQVFIYAPITFFKWVWSRGACVQDLIWVYVEVLVLNKKIAR